MIGAPFGHFPILRFLAPEMSGYNAFLRVHQPLWKFLGDEIDNHKDTFDPASPRDLMDVYLNMLRSEDCSNTFSGDITFRISANPKLQQHACTNYNVTVLTEIQLLAICVDLFMAGSETTSKTLGFCFLNLILSQDVQKKAQEEIDRVIGRDRPPTLEDRAK